MAIDLKTDPAQPDAAAPPPEPAAEEDPRIEVTVRLKPFHYEYLVQRARATGETPERALETILRTYRSHHDTIRHGLNTAPQVPGMPAGTKRA